jgi:hypothetical protein
MVGELPRAIADGQGVQEQRQPRHLVVVEVPTTLCGGESIVHREEALLSQRYQADRVVGRTPGVEQLA